MCQELMTTYFSRHDSIMNCNFFPSIVLEQLHDLVIFIKNGDELFLYYGKDYTFNLNQREEKNIIIKQNLIHLIKIISSNRL